MSDFTSAARLEGGESHTAMVEGEDEALCRLLIFYNIFCAS